MSVSGLLGSWVGGMCVCGPHTCYVVLLHNVSMCKDVCAAIAGVLRGLCTINFDILLAL